MIYILIIFMILFVAALAWAVILKSENHDLKDTAITLKVLKDGKWLGAQEWQSEVTQEVDQWKEKYWDENRLHLDTRLELDHYTQVAIDLQAQIDDLTTSKPIEEQPEQGTFVKQRKLSAATPGTYRNVFDLDINGQRVLDHLQLTFANKSTYVRGGQDAERESCYRAGQASVIGFIFNQVNRANNPDYKESDND